MGLQVIALLMILAITFMHSIFGLFSGLINVFCTVMAVAVSLGFYDPMNRWLTSTLELHSAYTEPTCIFLLFFGTLIGLRSLADAKVRGNVHVPSWMDWGGAAICGIVNAQLIVGVLVICVTMLPIGASKLGFERYERSEDRNETNRDVAEFHRKSLWTRPDEMTIGLFNMLSRGSLKGSASFAGVYPDFSDAIFFATNTVQPESSPSPLRYKKGGDGFKNGLKLETWWEQKTPVEGLYRKGVPTEKERTPQLSPIVYKPSSGMRLIGARITLLPAAADRPDRGSAIHLFRPTQLRLVGEEDGTPAQYVARILGNTDNFSQGKTRIVDMDNNFSIPADGEKTIDVWFEVPTDFAPRFVEYRHQARVALGGEPAKTPPTVALAWGGALSEEQRQRQAAGARTFGSVLEPQSEQNIRLPFEMGLDAVRRMPDVKLDGERLLQGRISGPKTRFERPPNAPGVSEMKPPDNMRMLQIKYRPKQARSLAGQVFNFAGQVNQYFARDEAGGKHPLVGYYATVRRGNQEYIELFLNGPGDDKINPSYSGFLDFKELTRQELNEQDDAIISLIFYVEPGRRIVKIENQTGDGGEVSIPIGP